MNACRLHHVTATDSTNDDVKAAAEAGEPEGYAVLAREQNAGRGRHGRHWQSPPGNLYCSVLLRPQTSQPPGAYSFIAALAIADTIKAMLPQALVALKWPNDVLIDKAKLSGVLIEGGEGYFVIGMGVNVMHHPVESLFPATSLVVHGMEKPDINLLADRLLTQLWGWYKVLQKDGFAPIRQAWLDYSLKGPMSVKLATGTVQGQFAGLGQDGSLKLHLADGSEQSIACGDVFIQN